VSDRNPGASRGRRDGWIQVASTSPELRVSDALRGFGPLATGLGIRKGTASRRCPFSVSDGLVRTDLATLACPPPVGVSFGRDANEAPVPDFIRAEPELAHFEILRPAHLLGRTKLIDRLGNVAGRHLFRFRLAVALGLRVRFRGCRPSALVGQNELIA
jgi:hypothetical protein